MRARDLQERITIDPNIMVGKPVIRGTRIPVGLILKMLVQRGINNSPVEFAPRGTSVPRFAA